MEMLIFTLKVVFAVSVSFLLLSLVIFVRAERNVERGWNSWLEDEPGPDIQRKYDAWLDGYEAWLLEGGDHERNAR